MPEAVTDTTAVVTTTDANKGGGVIDGFMAILSFRNEAFGDQIKFFLVMLLAFYLIFNYMRWQMIAGKIMALESHIRSLEDIAKELLDRSSSCST